MKQAGQGGDRNQLAPYSTLSERNFILEVGRVDAGLRKTSVA